MVVVGAVVEDVDDVGEVDVVGALPADERGVVGWPVVVVFGAAFGEPPQAASDSAAAALTPATAMMRRLKRRRDRAGGRLVADARSPAGGEVRSKRSVMVGPPHGIQSAGSRAGVRFSHAGSARW